MTYYMDYRLFITLILLHTFKKKLLFFYYSYFSSLSFLIFQFFLS